MREDFSSLPVKEFFEDLIIEHISHLLPGGKRWLRMHEVEKLIDIPREEIIQLAEEGKIWVSYLGDNEIFDYREICEAIEGSKRMKAPPELREKFG